MRTGSLKALALGALLVSMPLHTPAAAQGSRDALLVSTAWLADHLKDPNLVIFQLGVKTDYDNGHIPGARFITLDDVAVGLKSAVAKGGEK